MTVLFNPSTMTPTRYRYGTGSAPAHDMQNSANELCKAGVQVTANTTRLLIKAQDQLEIGNLALPSARPGARSAN